MVAWPEGTSRGFKQERDSGIAKAATSDFKVGCSFQHKLCQSNLTLGNHQGLACQHFWNRGHLYSECDSCFFLWNISMLFPLKWTESTSHHGRLRGKCRLEETFARVKMEHGKERKHHFRPSSFLDYRFSLRYSWFTMYISFGCTAKWVSYTYIPSFKIFSHIGRLFFLVKREYYSIQIPFWCTWIKIKRICCPR